MPRKLAKKANYPRREHPVHYIIEIADWEWSFSFGIGWNQSIDRGPYSDYRHLVVKGVLLRPSKIKTKAAEITLLPSKRLNEAERSRDEPRAVGSINIHQDTMKPLLSMPQDALDGVLQMLIAGRFKYLVMTGEKLRYRRGAVISYRFECRIEEDDLPAED